MNIVLNIINCIALNTQTMTKMNDVYIKCRNKRKLGQR